MSEQHSAENVAGLPTSEQRAQWRRDAEEWRATFDWHGFPTRVLTLLDALDSVEQIAKVNHGLYRSAEADLTRAIPPGEGRA